MYKTIFSLCLLLMAGTHSSVFAGEIDTALAEKDHDRVIAIFAAAKLSEAEIDRINAWLGNEKEKYRKRYTRAIREKATESIAAGRHLHSELLRLIKGNLVEDDLDYTVTCIEAAATSKNPDLIYVIAPFLVHPQSRLRAVANNAVAAKRDERVYPLVGQLLAGENAIDKVYAMETLLALKDERAVPLLLLQLSNPNKNVRYFALKTLDAIRSDKAQHGVISAAQSDKDQEVRLKAIEILRHLRTGPVFSALQRLLSDPVIAAREKALDSALSTGDKRYANAISEQLAHEKEQHHKHALLKALLDLGSGGGMNGVLTLLRHETDASLILWSAVACNRFNEIRCADPLAALLSATKDVPILLECLVALASFKPRKHLSALVAVMQDATQTTLVRSAALTAIQAIDSEAAITPLFDAYAKEREQALRVQMHMLLSDLMRRKLPKV